MPSTRPKAGGTRPEGLFQPPLAAQPLAARMRPRTLDEYVGQTHLVGPDGPLRKGLERGYLGSMYLWGPPGVGKTSLARRFAGIIDANVIALSAVETGVVEMRAAVAEARELLTTQGRRTVLFIDEGHRLNKAQQDALLPHVEDGTVTLVLSGTENPYSYELSPAVGNG